RLLWLTFFRTVVTTLIMGGLALQLVGDRSRPDLSLGDVASFGLIGASYVFTLINGVLLRAGRVGRSAAWVQIPFDVLLAGAVVFVTGGARSPFAFLFLVSIIGAAVLLGTRGAVAGLLGAAVGYSLVVGWQLSSAPYLDRRLVSEVGVQLLAQLLIAVLAGYVGEQLSRTGGSLSARERDLRALTVLQNEIVRAMPSGLVTSDAYGLVSFANPAAEAIFGVPTPSMLGSSLDAIIPGAINAPRGRRIERRVTTPRGELILGLSVTPLAGGEGLLVVFQDLTELRRVETELERIDHLATLGRLSAQLAHEIRNPLAAMRGSAQMLVSDAAGGATSERLAKLIVRESDRLAELVEGYLKLARPPPPRLAPTRLDEVVRETLELLRSDPSFAAVQVEEWVAPVTAACDASQLKQVLINLLRNGAHAVQPSRGRLRVAVDSKDGVPVVEVWDSAGAIAGEDLPRIFEPFFSRSKGGSGLGLSTVQTIVQAHGGRIDVTSSPATGTLFSVKLRAE
ncbi:MAG: ATP-binding protein, partial [Archangium sp.]